MCETIWRHYNDDLITSDLFGQKFLNDWHVGTVNCIQYDRSLWTCASKISSLSPVVQTFLMIVCLQCLRLVHRWLSCNLTQSLLSYALRLPTHLCSIHYARSLWLKYIEVNIFNTFFPFLLKKLLHSFYIYSFHLFFHIKQLSKY